MSNLVIVKEQSWLNTMEYFSFVVWASEGFTMRNNFYSRLQLTHLIAMQIHVIYVPLFISPDTASSVF